MVDDQFQCEMTILSNAEFQTISGPLCKSSHISKQLVCLEEACKKLHHMGALTDHIHPHNESLRLNLLRIKKHHLVQVG